MKHAPTFPNTIPAASALGRWWTRAGGTQFIAVSWKNALETSFSVSQARLLLTAHLTRERGFTLKARSGERDELRRGDFRITELPGPRDVGWRDVPLSLAVTYADARPRAIIELRYIAPPDLAFDNAAKTFLMRHAEADFQQAIEFLNCAHRVNDHPQPEQQSLADDLETLQLEPDATWSQAQDAYRRAARLFHPDRFAGQDVPPQLVELAQRRFVEIAAAYQRLRARMGG